MKEHLNRKLEQLNRETERMYDYISDLDEEMLHNTAYGWSIIQVFAHLNTAEQGSTLYMRKKMQAGSSMPEFSLQHKFKFFLTKGLLQSGLKWKAPSMVAHPEGSYTLMEMKEKWSQTRQETEKFVSEYPEEFLRKAVYKHPMAGRLDLAAAIDSFIYHQRHHVHQLRRIRQKIQPNA